MHERSLVADLVRRVEQEAGDARVTGVRVRLGKLSHLSPQHLRDHFAIAAAGSVAAGAELTVDVGTDITDPHAADLVLASIDVAEAA